jgi:hypothetical protein
MTAETPLPTNRTIASSRDDHVADHNTLHAHNNARLPAANPTGVTIQEMTDPVAGGTMKVLSFPADQAAIAIMIDGDAFPRWLIPSDATDGLYFGDGTYDPYAEGGFIAAGAGDLRIAAPQGDNDISLRPQGTGVVSVAGDLATSGHLDVGNATTSGAHVLGSVVGHVEIFRAGVSLGFLPIYDTIS